ncbi:MAG: hypothetical protein V4484_22185 [Pseudomonadota bacterium]
MTTLLQRIYPALAIALAACNCCAAAPPLQDTVHFFTYENDVNFSTDRFCTSGVQFSTKQASDQRYEQAYTLLSADRRTLTTLIGQLGVTGKLSLAYGTRLDFPGTRTASHGPWFLQFKVTRRSPEFRSSLPVPRHRVAALTIGTEF